MTSFQSHPTISQTSISESMHLGSDFHWLITYRNPFFPALSVSHWVTGNGAFSIPRESAGTSQQTPIFSPCLNGSPQWPRRQCYISITTSWFVRTSLIRLGLIGIKFYICICHFIFSVRHAIPIVAHSQPLSDTHASLKVASGNRVSVKSPSQCSPRWRRTSTTTRRRKMSSRD